MTHYSKNSQDEYKEGSLESSKEGTVAKIKKPKYFIPIGLSEARIKGAKIPSNPINSL